MGARWISRRALVLHGLLIVVVPLCFVAGWWQLHQALSGNSLSWAYTVEWPIFAVIAVVAWWQLLHEDASERVARAERARLDIERVAAERSAPGSEVVEADGANSERVAIAARREYQAHLERTR